MSMSVSDPRHNNGIVLPKIFPNDTEITASFLRTNDFAEEERLETKGEDAEKKNLSQALAVKGEILKEKTTFCLRKKYMQTLQRGKCL